MLWSDSLLALLNDDAMHVVGNGGTVNAVDACRRTLFGLCGFNTIGLARHFSKLCTGGSDVGQELGISVQTGIAGCCHKARGINVGLPMVADYDAALSPLITQFQDVVLGSRIDFSEQQGHGPSTNGMAGGIGAVHAQALFTFGQQGGLVEAGIWPLAHVLDFWFCGSETYRQHTPIEDVINARCFFF